MACVFSGPRGPQKLGSRAAHSTQLDSVRKVFLPTARNGTCSGHDVRDDLPVVRRSRPVLRDRAESPPGRRRRSRVELLRSRRCLWRK
eukprot:5831806-Pyramimonas_sp.AAC.1